MDFYYLCLLCKKLIVSPRHIVAIFALTFFGQWAYSQRIDLTIGAGSSHFLGDLGGKVSFGTNDPSDLDIPTTRYALGLGIRLQPNKHFAIRVNGFYGRLAGDDKYTTNRPRRLRNLSFFSPIVEANALIELHLGKEKRFYGFIGGGIFYYNPKTKYNGQIYQLRDYGTEGQYFLPGKKPYGTTAFSLPWGFGYKFKIYESGAYWSYEIMWRKSTTDYIDDVSTQYVDKAQLMASNGPIAVALSDRSIPEILGFSEPGAIRGDPKDNDNFTFMMFTYHHPLSGAPAGAGFKKRRRGGGSMKFNRKCPEF